MIAALRHREEQDTGEFTLSMSTPAGSTKLALSCDVDYKIVEKGDKLIIVSPSNENYIIASEATYEENLTTLKSHVLSLALRTHHGQVLAQDDQDYLENHINFKKPIHPSKRIVIAGEVNVHNILNGENRI